MRTMVCVILLLFAAGCAGQKMTSLKEMPADVPVQRISLKGENCEWTPDVIRAAQGHHVILEVESVDWDYNFQLKGYDLRFEIPEGEKVTAEFYTSDTGEFEFGCYIERGLRYHWGGMVGKLIVE